jgi:hypothetical protein
LRASSGASTDLAFVQAAAPGSNLAATVTNSNAQAAQRFSGAGADRTRTVVIFVAENGTRDTALAGGIEFDPLDGGAAGLLTQVQASNFPISLRRGSARSS